MDASRTESCTASIKGIRSNPYGQLFYFCNNAQATDCYKHEVALQIFPFGESSEYGNNWFGTWPVFNHQVQKWFDWEYEVIKDDFAQRTYYESRT